MLTPSRETSQKVTAVVVVVLVVYHRDKFIYLYDKYTLLLTTGTMEFVTHIY
jgi:CTP:phosphocholine cytidylyltransferase-like protein